MESIEDILAANIREWRKNRGLSQEALAERSGLSLQTIHSVESKKRWPSPETIAALANALDVPQGMLFNSAFANLERPAITPKEALEALSQFVHKESVSVLSQPKQDLFALLSTLDDAQIAGQLDRLRAEFLAPEIAELEDRKENKKAR